MLEFLEPSLPLLFLFQEPRQAVNLKERSEDCITWQSYKRMVTERIRDKLT